MKEVSLPDDAMLNRYAFAKTGLKNIVFRGELNAAEPMSFWYNEQLTAVVLPKTGRLGFGAFADCGLVSADLSETHLEELGYCTFMNCEQLETISLPPTLRSAGTSTFALTSSLTEIVFPASLTSFHPTDILGSNVQRLVFQGNAPLCTPYSRFDRKDLVIEICEGAAGFDVSPWKEQPIVVTAK